MPSRPPTFRPRWIGSRKEAAAAFEKTRARERGAPAERGYDGAWAKAAAAFRARYPACAYCWLEGRQGPAELVDHLYPHGLRRGVADAAARALFWARPYWVSACGQCHRRVKPSAEREGLAALDALARRLGLPPLSDEAQRAACARALVAMQGPGWGG